MDDLKQRLSGEVDYGAWQGLLTVATKKGWCGERDLKLNVDLLLTAETLNRPDLLIPVALSMVPDEMGWAIYMTSAAIDITDPNTGLPTRFIDTDAEYSAAALALAVIEARTK